MSMTVYARGFLGSAEKAAKVERAAIKKPFPTIFDSVGKSSVVVVNPDVMQMYEQLVRRDVNSESWDWRENVIKVACQSFGGGNVYGWAMANLHAPTVSQTHVDFLCDMFDYVLGSRDRRLPPKTWEDLIAPQARGNDIHISGYLADVLTGNYMLSKNGCNLSDTRLPDYDMKVHTFINRWLSKRDGVGFSDMVLTLNTLFGDFTFH